MIKGSFELSDKAKRFSEKAKQFGDIAWFESATIAELEKIAGDCTPEAIAVISQLTDEELKTIIRGESCPRFDELLGVKSPIT
jgi:hypothetical protein